MSITRYSNGLLLGTATLASLLACQHSLPEPQSPKMENSRTSVQAVLPTSMDNCDLDLFYDKIYGDDVKSAIGQGKACLSSHQVLVDKYCLGDTCDSSYLMDIIGVGTWHILLAVADALAGLNNAAMEHLMAGESFARKWPGLFFEIALGWEDLLTRTRAFILERNGQFQEAKTVYKQLKPPAYGRLAKIAAEERDFEEAQRLATLALDGADMDQPAALLVLARIYQHKQDFPSALHRYKQADELMKIKIALFHRGEHWIHSIYAFVDRREVLSGIGSGDFKTR